VVWAPGKTNLADYFTKIHPVAHHFEMRIFFVQTNKNNGQIEKDNANIRRNKRRKLATSKGVLLSFGPAVVDCVPQDGSRLSDMERPSDKERPPDMERPLGTECPQLWLDD
jgi:hypothetical protein